MPETRRGESAFELGSTCRTLREQAGLSLGEMAELVHRDASSLSRFERGHSRPRDLERLVETYRGLARGTQPKVQRPGKFRVWPLLYLGASLVALVVLLVASQHSQTDADLRRAWTMGTALLLVTVTLRQVRDGSLRDRLAGVTYSAFVLTVGAVSLRAWGDPASALIVAVDVPALVLGLVTYALRAGPGD